MADRAKQGRVENTVNIRKIALDVLLQIMEEGVFCHIALHQALLKREEIVQRDRNFLTRLVEGTVERAIEMDYIIDLYSKVKIRKMKPVIRNILRMAVYQILYMEQVPDSAACNEAVKLVAKWKLSNLKGFVNGVLRTIVRSKETISYPDEKKNRQRALSVRYSMPEWIVSFLQKEYGLKRAESIMEAFLCNDHTVTIRRNISRCTKEELESFLQNDGVELKDGKLLPYAYTLSGGKSLTELEAFQKGFFQVQDESSMLVGQIASPKKDDVVFDVCAAPGGKSLHCADILAGSGHVLSMDITEKKTALIQENASRLSFTNVETRVMDATVFCEELSEKADVIIADLPCSGLGVIGKKCDIKYKTQESDISSLAQIQRNILKNVISYLKPGGTLVFSTCTIASDENIRNVEWITKNLPVTPVSIEEELPLPLKGLTGKEGYLQILPDMAGTDGFFIAKFIKRK